MRIPCEDESIEAPGTGPARGFRAQGDTAAEAETRLDVIDARGLVFSIVTAGSITFYLIHRQDKVRLRRHGEKLELQAAREEGAIDGVETPFVAPFVIVAENGGFWLPLAPLGGSKTAGGEIPRELVMA